MKISPRKKAAQKDITPAVSQCPVDKVWNNKYCTVTLHHSATYFWQTECDVFDQIQNKNTCLYCGDRELWNVRHDLLSWHWQVHYTCITAIMVLFMSSFLLPLLLCLFWTGCCASWGSKCFSVQSLLPILHEKKHCGWHIFDTIHLFLSLDDAFQRGPRCHHCQMSPK